MNDFFVTQTRIYENEAPRLPDLPNVTKHLDDISITPDEVELVLESLPLGKAAGPDDINNRILREPSHVFGGPLRALFNYSIQIAHGKKLMFLLSINMDDPSLNNIYRPISLISTINKVFE
jgi:hypothetical protein